MTQALCTAGVLATLGVRSLMAWPRPLPAASTLRTVTMWWVIFNQPAFCRGGGPGSCTGMDLTNTAAETALVWAAEHQVHPEVPISLKATLPVTRRHRPSAAGVTNPLGTEVHLALLTHRVPTPIHQRTRLVAALSGTCTQPACAPLSGRSSTGLRPSTRTATPPARSGAWRMGCTSRCQAPRV